MLMQRPPRRHTRTRFAIAVGIVALAAVSMRPDDAAAQKWPERSVRIVTPFGPGGGTDIFARILAQRFSERLGQQFIVENRPGAGSTIGTEYVARAPADGYTIGMGQGGNMSVVPHTMKKVPYDALKDFQPIALIATNYLALVVHPSTPFRNVGDLVKYLKANPGKVAFASNGEGAFLHMATELFRSHVGFTYLHVPFKGVAQIAQELMSGGVDVTFSSFTSMYPYVQAGKVRLLGIAKETRAANYPDIPAIAETVPGFSSGGWFGFVAPARLLVTHAPAVHILVLGASSLRHRVPPHGSLRNTRPANAHGRCR